MALRSPLVAGNWKMHTTTAEARALAMAVAAVASAANGVEVLVAPPFTALSGVAETLRGSRVGVAAQDMHWADAGAYTGEVSPPMVRELATHVLLGHSERRQHFGETDEAVSRKLAAALGHGLVPLVCIGETAAERDAGCTDLAISHQLALGLGEVGAEHAGELVVAYEPVWAIGSGRACEPAEAGRVAGFVRGWCAAVWGGEVAARVRVLYGGSVGPANAAELFAASDVDGALVGGASLDAEAFGAILRAAARSAA
jgi:triosephosphate isomerase